jgi:hypothetical protein
VNIPIKWVGQRGGHDCGIATIAMALGVTYEEAESEIGYPVRLLQSFRGVENQGLRHLLQESPLDDYQLGLKRLADRMLKNVRMLYEAKDCPEDQKVKLGRVYRASVKSDYETGAHAVVIDADGTVFDPNNETLRLHYSKFVVLRLNYEITDCPKTPYPA